MEAKELRIGNYLYFSEDKILKVSEIQENCFYAKSENNDEFKDTCYEIKPIPLTEEWLLKFGFTRHHTDYSNGVLYILDVPNNNEFNWGVYPFELGSGFIINKSKYLKYVHQLQNLYFALTNEELTIKE